MAETEVMQNVICHNVAGRSSITPSNSCLAQTKTHRHNITASQSLTFQTARVEKSPRQKNRKTIASGENFTMQNKTHHSSAGNSSEDENRGAIISSGQHDITAMQNLTYPHANPYAAGRCGSSSDVSRASSNAARERCRVESLRTAFLELQRILPAVPKDTKLSKLDVLVLATAYIAHLTSTLARQSTDPCQDDATGTFTTTNASSSAICHNNATMPGKGCHVTSKPSRFPAIVGGPSCQEPGRNKGKQQETGSADGGKSAACIMRAHHGYLHPVKKWPMRTRLYAGIVARAQGLRETNQ